jgi:hypothetical protein
LIVSKNIHGETAKMIYHWQTKEQIEYIQKMVDCVKIHHEKDVFEWFCLMLSKWFDELPHDDFGIDTALEAAEFDARQKFNLEYLLF